MKCRFPLSLVLLATACAGGPAPEAVTGSARPIVGGLPDERDAPVVLIIADVADGAWLCSGTLIAPSTVLTAAHCTDPAVTRMRVFFTSTWGIENDDVICTTPGCTWVEVAEQVPHPNASDSDLTFGFDLALLRLASPVTSVPWIPVSELPMGDELRNRNARHVGFGLTDPGGGTPLGKNEALILIQEIQPRLFRSDGYGKSVCSGDSGGPVLLATGGLPFERVIGVTSFGDRTCTTGWSVRVDWLIDFVTSTMATWEPAPSCTLDGYCLTAGCATVDPDCRGFLEACTSDAACAEGSCWADAQHHGAYCSHACTTPADCGAGATCGTSGRCELPQVHPVDPGQPCAASDFCTGFGVCDGATAGDLRCRTPCDPAATASICPSPLQTCVTGVAGSAYCKDPPPAPPAPAKASGGGCGSAGGGWALAVLPLLAVLRRRSLTAG